MRNGRACKLPGRLLSSDAKLVHQVVGSTLELDGHVTLQITTVLAIPGLTSNKAFVAKNLLT